jgi:hypothetical protein
MKTKVTLGPYFLPRHASRQHASAISPLGFCLEWATPGYAKTIPLFYRRDPKLGDRIRLAGILFPISQLPFSLKCPSHHIVQEVDESFAPMESLLVGLYKRFDVRRSIFEVLAEIVSRIPLHGSVTEPILTRGLLLDELEERGFRLNALFHSADAKIAEIAWQAPQIDYRFHVCSCAFAPDSEQVRWIKPSIIGTSQLLFDELQQIARGPAATILAPAGKLFTRVGVLE